MGDGCNRCWVKILLLPVLKCYRSQSMLNIRIIFHIISWQIDWIDHNISDLEANPIPCADDIRPPMYKPLNNTFNSLNC
eukprot:3311258-Amphidinium_carterae.1